MTTPVEPHGILNVNKPSGMTSREVVDLVGRRLPRKTKVGHAGTLDPLASGVLVVCVGSAVRLVEYVQRMPKRYRATFLLGRRSPTEDTDGEVTELVNPPIPAREQIGEAVKQFVGQIQQRPPAFSALKVRGRRAYDLARAGKPVALAPRPVTVYRLEVVGYEYPRLELEIECGSGTYVRALGRDLAESLGTAAVMSALERTAVGSFRVDEAVDPRQLTAENWRDSLLPSVRAVELLPRVELSPEEAAIIAHGRSIRVPEGHLGESEIAALDASGRLAAILAPRDGGLLGPVKNFPPG